MEAQVWMTGRVGGEVEVRDSTSPWSTFRLACTPRTVRAGEWGDEQTMWVTVSCTHRLAEHVRLSLRKGDPVIVVGKLRARRWVDGNGVEHEQLQVRASSVGHDLSVGTSSFYRPRREAPAEPVGDEAANAASAEPGEEGFAVPDFYEEPAVQAEPEAAPTEVVEPEPVVGLLPEAAVVGLPDPEPPLDPDPVVGAEPEQEVSRRGRRRAP